jgi:beta-carotene ketolase (CrtW type)
MSNALFLTKSVTLARLDSLLGILIAGVIMLLWLSSLIALLSIDSSQIPLFLIVLAVLGRTLLHTGLFITAHDAMHGTIFPKNRQLNDFIGSLATQLYALLPYQTLLKKHGLHHRYPASEKDPDFCGQGRTNPLLWYIQFMKGYLEGKQTWVLIIGMTLIFSYLRWGLNIPISNLFLFWVLPLLLSSIQLFYFGVFLPHRRPKVGYSNRHRAKSSYYSVFWSFLACYHFGYHLEHHEFPHLPWYKLPLAVEKN